MKMNLSSRPIKLFNQSASIQGFTLIEVMISLALGLILSASVIQIMVSNSLTQNLNRAIASSQESGRYIMSRLRNDIIMAGYYDSLDPNLSDLVDNAEEESFVRNHPIPIPGDFIERPALGAQQGIDGSDDVLVIALQADRDCRGYKLGYDDTSSFFTVNEYFVSDGKLKCRGFDGRYLRGQKAAVGHNNHAAFTLLDDVESWQITYGITDSSTNTDDGIASRYVHAGLLSNAYANGEQVVSVRVAIVIKGEGDMELDSTFTYTLLNEETQSASDNGLYKVFETTIMLRNMRNFVRGNA